MDRDRGRAFKPVVQVLDTAVPASKGPVQCRQRHPSTCSRIVRTPSAEPGAFEAHCAKPKPKLAAVPHPAPGARCDRRRSGRAHPGVCQSRRLGPSRPSHAQSRSQQTATDADCGTWSDPHRRPESRSTWTYEVTVERIRTPCSTWSSPTAAVSSHRCDINNDGAVEDSARPPRPAQPRSIVLLHGHRHVAHAEGLFASTATVVGQQLRRPDRQLPGQRRFLRTTTPNRQINDQPWRCHPDAGERRLTQTARTGSIRLQEGEPRSPGPTW